MVKALPRFGEMVCKDLTGWEILIGYWVELAHDLIGTFPALYEDNEIIVTTSRGLLDQVIEILNKERNRHNHINTIPLLYNEKLGIGYNLQMIHKNGTINGDLAPFIILTKDKFEKLKDQRPFYWAPGLISFAD